MELYPFINTFTSAVAADDSLDAWTMTNFSKSLTVLVDLQSNALPTSDDMPYAIFQTPGISKDQERRINEYAFGVDLAFTKNALQVRAESNIGEPAGIELVSEFIAMVVDAIEAVVPANFAFGYQVAADTLGSLPEVYAYLDFEFRQTHTIGSNPIG